MHKKNVIFNNYFGVFQLEGKGIFQHFVGTVACNKNLTLKLFYKYNNYNNQ